MTALTARLKQTLLLVFLTAAAITHSHAAISPELAAALQKKRITTAEKAWIEKSEELQALYQYILVDQNFPNELSIHISEVDPSKIPATKNKYGFSDYKAAVVGTAMIGNDAVMVDKDGKIRYLEYRPETQEDIDFLSRFKKLNYLRLQSISKDLESVSLASLRELKELNFKLSATERLQFGSETLPISTILMSSSENLKHLVNIKNLKHLERLTVFPSTLSNYTELEHNTNLKHLDLEATSGIMLPDFSKLNELNHMEVWAKTPIGEVSLKNCKNLEKLILNPVSLKDLKLPTSIKALSLYGTKAKEDLNNLSHLNKLEDLFLKYFPIDSLGDLPEFKKLIRLELSDNEIKTLDGIDKFSTLRELAIYSGNLNETPNLTKLPKLTTLTLRNQKIEKIDHLKSWKNLEKINLRSNKIEKIDGLRYLTSLKEMDLTNNPLYEVSQTDLDAMVEQKFDGYINVKESEFGMNIIYDDELIKKYFFFKKNR